MYQGDVYSWGQGRYAQLGTGVKVGLFLSPSVPVL